MTGDSSRRKQALSVFLSTLMVLSVLAMGMAGFAGSAAAQVEDPAGDKAAINANPADYDINSTTNGEDINHTVTFQIGSDLDGQSMNGAELFVNYSAGDIQADNFSSTENVTVEVIRDGSVVEGNDGTTGFGVFAGSNQGVNVPNSNDVRVAFGDSVGNSFQQDDVVRLILHGNQTAVAGDESANITHPTSSGSTDVDLEIAAGGNSESTTATLPLGDNAPIEVDNGNYYSSFEVASSAANNFINVTGTVSELEASNKSLDNANTTIHSNLGTASITNDIVVQGVDSTQTVRFANVDGSAITAATDVSSNNDVTIDNLAFESSDVVNQHLEKAVTSSATPVRLNITNNEFTDFTHSSSEGVVDVQDGDALVIEGNTFDKTAQNYDGIYVNSASGDIDVNSNTLDNVTDGVGIEINSGNGDFVNLSTNTINDVQSGTGLSVDATGGNDNVDIKDITIEGDGSNTVGIKLASDSSGEIDISGSNTLINNTDVAISDSTNVDGAFLNITDAEINYVNSKGIQLDGSGDAEVNIDGVSVDNAAGADGIELARADGDTYISNADINGTQIGVALNDTATGDQFNLTDSTISNSNTGLYIDDGDVDTAVAHFNSFSQNDVGIDVQNTNNNADDVILTFNDITDSSTAGLNTNLGGNDEVTANYSYWGDATGPDGNDQVSGAYGSGDNVTLNSDSDASVYPFLTESISQFSDAELNGDKFVVLEDPQFPVAGANNNQAIGVTVLEFGNSQATTDNVTLQSSPSGAVGSRTLDDGSVLDPTNVEQFNVSTDSAGTVQFDALSKADAINDGSVSQTVTGQFDAASSTITDDNSELQSGQTVNFTVQLNDANGNAHEHQGVAVDWTSQNFGTAGVTFDSVDANTSNDGTATATISANNLQPGEDFTVRAFVGPNDDLFERTLTTATGSIDAGSSQLYLNDQTGDPAAQQVNTTHNIAAQINDSQDNPLSGETVTFSSNVSSVSFDSTSVTTDSDGFANTTVTLPTSDVGGIALNASAGSFSADQTGSARINVSTKAGDATTLGFATDTRSVAPTGQIDVEVQVQDEFGNYNDSATLGNNAITVTSGDTGVISVSDVNDLSSNNDTFTLTGESAGSTTVNVTSAESGISSVEDTFDVIDPNTGDLELTVAHNVATSSASGAANQADLTAQFVKADGTTLGLDGENITFAKQSGSAAELNQSDTFTKSTDSDGNVTIKVNGTSTTGDTSFIALAENFSVQDSVTVTTTGAANSISVSPETNSVGASETANVTVEFVDDAGRNVPKPGTSIQLSTDNGAIDDSPQSTAVGSDGQVTATLTYNASSADAGTANLTAVGDGVSGTASVTVTGADDGGDVPTDAQERALQITGKDDPANLTQDDVTAVITQFERGETVNGVDPAQDDVTTVITLFERN